jgi:DNA-binding protein HU-beta
MRRPALCKELLLNRREFIDAIAAHTRSEARAVDSFLKGLTDVVMATVAKGDSVVLTGFAKFARIETKARTGHNPATGRPMKIQASKRPHITPLKGFNDVVVGAVPTPKLTKGSSPRPNGNTAGFSKPSTGTGKAGFSKPGVGKTSSSKSSMSKSASSRPYTAKSASSRPNTAKTASSKSNTAKTKAISRPMVKTMVRKPATKKASAKAFAKR